MSHSLSLRAIVISTVFVAFPVSAQDGLPNSICRRTPALDTDYWRADSNLPAQLNARSGGSRNLTYTDLLNAVDQALQGIARQSRARIRHRVKTTPDTCSVNGTSPPCIVGRTNAQDNQCASEQGLAHGGCGANGNGCHVVICLDNIDAQNQCIEILQTEICSCSESSYCSQYNGLSCDEEIGRASC